MDGVKVRARRVLGADLLEQGAVRALQLLRERREGHDRRVPAHEGAVVGCSVFPGRDAEFVRQLPRALPVEITRGIVIAERAQDEREVLRPRSRARRC